MVRLIYLIVVFCSSIYFVISQIAAIDSNRIIYHDYNNPQG